MSFASPIFFFLFLPLALIVNQVISPKFRNIYLLLISIFFYSFTQWQFLPVILLSVIFNYYVGRRVSKGKLTLLFFAIIINSGLLVYYKFFAPLDPLGISFYTFLAISYLVDIYQKKAISSTFANTALYLLFFPHISAGPITKYQDFNAQLSSHTIHESHITEGISRIVIGMSQKLLLANSLAIVADYSFSSPTSLLSMSLAWAGILSYTLQIYFDFLGYSNMAIGLASLFGFKLSENFNYPYIATSITDFWSRWHISLTSWLRQYIYFPLGGSRLGAIRTYINILLVFVVSGLWHGVGWRFLVWGIWHAMFMIIEKIAKDLNLKLSIHPLFSRMYMILIVMLGWVIFRATSLTHAFEYVQAMFLPNFEGIKNQILLSPYTIFILFISFIISIGAGQRVLSKNRLLNLVFVTMLLFFSILALAGSTFNSFIYSQF